MKKFSMIAVLLFSVICFTSDSFAQIRVIGPSGSEEIPIGKPLPDDVVIVPNPDGGGGGGDGVIIDPIPVDPVEPWDPYQYLNEIRAKTLDQYGDQVADNILLGLLASGAELLGSATDYVVPTKEEIKAHFFEQVQSFGLSDVTPETLVGTFVDQIAQNIIAKLSDLSSIEKQVVGIWLPESNEAVLYLSQNIIWQLEGLTGQKYYTELYDLLYQYVEWPYYKDRPNPDGTLPPEDLKPGDGTDPGTGGPETGTGNDSAVSVEKLRSNVTKNAR